MKKLLSLAVLFAALAATVGCNDGKTTAGGVKPGTNTVTVTTTKTP